VTTLRAVGTRDFQAGAFDDFVATIYELNLKAGK
jgi:hypothetical protein